MKRKYRIKEKKTFDDRQNINNIPEKFHAANAHDIMEYLMSL